jgi:hypothetical protein
MARITEISSTPVQVVSLEQAKAFLRVDHSADDTLITDLISHAQAEAETYTGLLFADATYSYEDYGGGQKWLTYPQPINEILTVQVEGSDVSYRDNLDGSINVGIDGDVASDSVVVITYKCGIGTPTADVPAALLQRIKFSYDYGDDMPYDKARFFDRILFRYRNSFTS